MALPFFGLSRIGQIKPPLVTRDSVVKVASLVDLAGTKASVVQKRAEWKDYVDLVALMAVGVSLPMALSAAQVIYQDQFNPQIILKALSYFKAIKGLNPTNKRNLQDAVPAVDLDNLPNVNVLEEFALESKL